MIAMALLFWDIETRSAVDLEIVGPWRYAADPTTEVLCVGFAIDDAPPQIWVPDQPVPASFHEAPNDSGWEVIARNYAFERAIATCILEPRFGWPPIPLAQQRCTMSVALASALPGALEAAATALGLPVQKDREGDRLMRQMVRPRGPRKGEDRDRLHWVDGLEQQPSWPFV